MLDAIETGQLTILGRVATILLPRQTYNESLTMRQDASRMRGHAVRVPLPNVLVTAMEDPNVRHAMRLTIYPSPRGVMVLCLTLQVGEIQLRTIANLNQEGIAGWVEALAETRVAQWLVEIEETGQVAWVHRNLTVPSMEPIRELIGTSARLSVVEETLELIGVLDAMAHFAETTSLLPGIRVTTVVFAAVAATGHEEPGPVH